MATVKLGSKAVGSIVKIGVNGSMREFIVVHQGLPSSMYDASCDGVWVLMRNVYEIRAWNNRKFNDYANSAVHSYLNSEFLNLIDANIRSQIKQVKIPYRPGNGASQSVNSGANGLTSKIFLLSGREVGYIQCNDNHYQYVVNDGSKLSYFKDCAGSSVDASDKVATSNGSAASWFLRSPLANSEIVITVGGDGKLRGYGSGGIDACGIRPAMILPATLLVSDDGTVTQNTAPATPPSISVPGSINGGSTITVSWGASSDSEGNLAGYAVERSTNGGASWEQIYNGAAQSISNYVAFGTPSVIYRVKSYDSEGAQSGWRTSSQVTVINNTAPGTPGGIYIPASIYGDTTITISWDASSDAEGNLSGYIAEKSYNGGVSWEQIYNGAARAINDYVPFGTPTVMYRVKGYDSGGAQSDYRTSAQVSVINNTAPGTPGAIRIPSSISGDTTITISWDASYDAENNVGGYIVERSTNGGSAWEQIYQGSSSSTTNFVAFGTPTVMYRVKAYDNYGLQSDYRTSTQVTVLNNTAPATPASITVPITVDGGKPLTITWGGSSDAENNLAGYSLERQVDGGSWVVIYTGAALSYVDTITKGWGSVAYRVQAYDAYDMRSGYATSATRTVNNNTAPIIICSNVNGSNLGTKNDGFNVRYKVADIDEGDTLTVTEAIDGVVLRTFKVKTGVYQEFNVTGLTYMRVLNGTHTLTITASDGKAETRHTLTFTKSVTAVMVTLAEPLPADAPITLCVISVTGSIPMDAGYTVEVTNNGADDTPVWEDCTAAVKNGANHVFTNQTAVNGPAFNFRINAERGSSGLGGYITSIQGGFQ